MSRANLVNGMFSTHAAAAVELSAARGDSLALESTCVNAGESADSWSSNWEAAWIDLGGEA
jgi:hypothetical protein